MEFGNQMNGDIVVQCFNFLSSWGELDFSYIMKKWRSGFVELMMYIPTTHTYYIGNISGCPQYLDEVQDPRPNISAMLDDETSYSWTVPDTATQISVTLNKSVYRTCEVFGSEIYGNSLPLGIYRSPFGNSNVSSTMYNSMIVPSIVTGLPDPDDDDYATFSFQCFGTDAQAI